MQFAVISWQIKEKETIIRESFDRDGLLKDIKGLLEEEIDMWYFGLIKKGWDRFARQVMQEKEQIHKALGKNLEGLWVDEKMVGLKEYHIPIPNDDINEKEVDENINTDNECPSCGYKW